MTLKKPTKPIEEICRNVAREMHGGLERTPEQIASTDRIYREFIDCANLTPEKREEVWGYYKSLYENGGVKDEKSNNNRTAHRNDSFEWMRTLC